jgi:hypothetical protein
MNRGQLLTLLGGIGLILGAALPWATLTSYYFRVTTSKAGFEGDGMITGAIGVILILFAILEKGKTGKLYSVAVIIFAILAELVVFYDLPRVLSFISSAKSDYKASVGVGIYITIIGAILAVAGGFQRVPGDPAEVRPPPASP